MSFLNGNSLKLSLWVPEQVHDRWLTDQVKLTGRFRENTIVMPSGLFAGEMQEFLSTMDKQSVPQDKSATYEGLRRLVYAVDENGKYAGVTSSGWEVESFSTELAVTEMLRQRDDAWKRAREGLTSPLEYHMYRNRMDFDTLAMTTGVWRWRIKRHFKPAVFARLSDAMLLRYASVMGIAVESIKQLPDAP